MGVSGGGSRCAGAGVVGAMDVENLKEVGVTFGGDAVNDTALGAAVGGIAARMGDSAAAAKMDASAVGRVAEEPVVGVTAATAIEAGN